VRRPGEETRFLLVTPSTAIATENEPEAMGGAGERLTARTVGSRGGIAFLPLGRVPDPVTVAGRGLQPA